MVNVFAGYSQELRELFVEGISELKKNGIVITDAEEAWLDLKLRHALIDTIKVFSTNFEYKSFLERKEETTNYYAKILGILEIKFDLDERLEDITGEVTTVEFCNKVLERRKIWFELKNKYDKIQNEIIRMYLNTKFDEAVLSAEKQGAYAIFFKRPDWKGYRDETRQKRFLETLELIQNKRYTGEDVYVKESISLSGLITIVRADMSKTKKVFVSYMNGYTMLSGRSELAWELI